MRSSLHEIFRPLFLLRNNFVLRIFYLSFPLPWKPIWFTSPDTGSPAPAGIRSFPVCSVSSKHSRKCGNRCKTIRIEERKHTISDYPITTCPGGGMADTRVLEALAGRRAGSSPVLGTMTIHRPPYGMIPPLPPHSSRSATTIYHPLYRYPGA